MMRLTHFAGGHNLGQKTNSQEGVAHNAALLITKSLTLWTPAVGIIGG